MNRATILRVSAFRKHLMEGKRFYEGYIYQTNRKSYHVYTPEYRIWIDKEGNCYTYSIAKTEVSQQNPTGFKIVRKTAKPPQHVDVLTLRNRIMKDLRLVDPPYDRASGTRKQPREVIETIHAAAVRATEPGVFRDPAGIPSTGWPAEAPGSTDGAESTVAVAASTDRAPVEGYENTLDYDVLTLLTELWSRCGGSQEDLAWARERFVEIGFLLPEVETWAAILRPGNVSFEDMIADLEALGYKIRT